MHDYPPIDAGVEQLLYNMYTWLGTPSLDVVRCMQELNAVALKDSTYSLKQTYVSRGSAVMTTIMEIAFQRADPACGRYYPKLYLEIMYANAARWTCTLTCADNNLYFSSFSTLHNELKQFFGAAPSQVTQVTTQVTARPLLQESKTTPASRRIVEL